jgi:elongation factor Ts
LIDLEQVKKLRQISGAGILDCQKTLLETKGDLEKAVSLLREKGIIQAAKRAERKAQEGIIYSYIHAGDKIGVLLELNCETDFVARTDEFRNLAKELALQIAACAPYWIKTEDISEEIIEKEKEIYRTQVQGKPDKIVEQIIKGKLEKFYISVCLFEQVYIRDSEGKMKIKDLITQVMAKLGENIILRRFARFKVGEE